MEKTLIERLNPVSTIFDCKGCKYDIKTCDKDCTEGIILKFCEELEGMKQSEKITRKVTPIMSYRIHEKNMIIDKIIEKIKGGSKWKKH